MKRLPWSWFDHRTDLPQWLLADIGRIVVEWSVLERELEELIRLVADIPLKQGRIMTTGMNARTRLLVATNFIQAHVYNRKLDADFLKEFIDLADDIKEKLEGERNKFAHGLWDRRKSQWRVLRSTGARATPDLQPEIKRLSRAVLPQSEPVTQKDMADLIARLVAMNETVVDFCERVGAALAPLQHKSPQYSRRRRPLPARTKKAL